MIFFSCVQTFPTGYGRIGALNHPMIRYKNPIIPRRHFDALPIHDPYDPPWYHFGVERLFNIYGHRSLYDSFQYREKLKKKSAEEMLHKDDHIATAKDDIPRTAKNEHISMNERAIHSTESQLFQNTDSQNISGTYQVSTLPQMPSETPYHPNVYSLSDPPVPVFLNKWLVLLPQAPRHTHPTLLVTYLRQMNLYVLLLRQSKPHEMWFRISFKSLFKIMYTYTCM